MKTSLKLPRFIQLRRENSSALDLTSQDDGDGKIWWYETFSVLAVSSACIPCGNLIGYTSTAVPSMEKDASLGTLQSLQISAIGGLLPIGALIGALLSSVPLRYLGPRKTVIFFGMMALLTSCIMVGLARHISTILAGRLLGGIGVGATIACVPLYVIEVTSTNRRGKMGVMPQFLMVSGIVISYSLGAFLSWGKLALAIIAFVCVAVILLTLAPDPPKYLISKGNIPLAVETMERIQGRRAADALFASTKLPSSDLQKEVSNSNLPPPRPILGSMRQILVAMGIITIQQLTGINGVTFFAASIFNGSSSAFEGGHVPAIILGLTQVAASFLSLFFVEGFGRTFLLKTSTSILTVAGLGLGFYFYFVNDDTSLYWVPLVALIIFSFGFAIGVGPLTWILVAEILPQSIRSLINPFIIAYYWLCVALVTISFAFLRDLVNYHGIFWLYAGVAFVGLLFVLFFVPETKGKTSEEIEADFVRLKKEGLEKAGRSEVAAA